MYDFHRIIGKAVVECFGCMIGWLVGRLIGWLIGWALGRNGGSTGRRWADRWRRRGESRRDEVTLFMPGWGHVPPGLTLRVLFFLVILFAILMVLPLSLTLYFSWVFL